MRIRHLLHTAWALIDPPPPPAPPILERHVGLRCGAEGVAEAWTDLTHLGRVVRARLAANAEAARRRRPAPYLLESPEIGPTWLPWQMPGRARVLRLANRSDTAA